MRISFSIVDDETTNQDFQKWIATEGIGFEETYNSSAKLEISKRGNVLWTTAWSQFKYWRLTNGTWVYEGAEKGFIHQHLIPPVLHEALEEDRIQIHQVTGTYGIFSGQDALGDYKRRKRFWEQASTDSYTALVQCDLVHTGRHREWPVHIFEMANDRSLMLRTSPKNLKKVAGSQILQAIYRNLNDRLRREADPQYRLSQEQFGSLIAEMRSVPSTHQSARKHLTKI